MTPNEESKAVKKIANAILPNLVNSLYNDGIINDLDLNNQTLLFNKIEKYLTKNKLDFQIVIDHRETILRVAEQEFKNGNQDFATALFVTSIEHTLNRLIDLACDNKKIDKKTASEIIKSVNISGKSSWLLKLLGLPEFNSGHQKFLIEISAERNSYIHYKWKPDSYSGKVPDSGSKSLKREEKNIKIKKLIKYLKNYEARCEYNGNKKRIQKAVKK